MGEYNTQESGNTLRDGSMDLPSDGANGVVCPTTEVVPLGNKVHPKKQEREVGVRDTGNDSGETGTSSKTTLNPHRDGPSRLCTYTRVDNKSKYN